MRYVYHRVPPAMIGETLYPMNQLEQIDSERYAEYRSGYDGREELLKRHIPYLDCLWNDVLHCSPIHPTVLTEAIVAAGITNLPQQEYYQINADTGLDITDAVIFYRDSNKPGDIRFERADDADWSTVATIPQITLDHYKRAATGQEPLFAFHGIPHFLYKGSVDVSQLQKILV